MKHLVSSLIVCSPSPTCPSRSVVSSGETFVYAEIRRTSPHVLGPTSCVRFRPKTSSVLPAGTMNMLVSSIVHRVL